MWKHSSAMTGTMGYEKLFKYDVIESMFLRWPLQVLIALKPEYGQWGPLL